jgi:hypothetical protein
MTRVLQTYFTGLLVASTIGHAGIIINLPPPPPVSTLVVEQRHDGRTDLLSCNMLGGLRQNVDINAAFTKTCIGTLGGRVIYARSGYGTGDAYSIDLMSAKPDGSSQMVLCSGFVSGTNAALYGLAHTKVLLDSVHNRVVFEQSFGPAAHDIYSINADGSGLVALANDARDERLMGMANGRVFYELQWSGTDTDLYAVESNGLNKTSISSTGDNETFSALMANKVYYQRASGGVVGLWCAKPDGSSAVQLGGGAGSSNLVDTISGRALLLRTLPTGDQLVAQNEDGSSLVVLKDFGEVLGDRFWGGASNGYALFASAWTVDGNPASYSRIPMYGGGESVAASIDASIAGAYLLFGKVDDVTLWFQTFDGKQSDVWIQSPDGSGRVNLAMTPSDERIKKFTGGRLIYSRAAYRGDQMDLFSINQNGTGLVTLSATAYSDDYNILLDATVFYGINQGTTTNLRRVYIDGTGTVDLWTLPGSARVAAAL